MKNGALEKQRCDATAGFNKVRAHPEAGAYRCRLPFAEGGPTCGAVIGARRAIIQFETSTI